jgi:class 3 adenylate cyclase
MASSHQKGTVYPLSLSVSEEEKMDPMRYIDNTVSTTRSVSNYIHKEMEETVSSEVAPTVTHTTNTKTTTTNTTENVNYSMRPITLLFKESHVEEQFLKWYLGEDFTRFKIMSALLLTIHVLYFFLYDMQYDDNHYYITLSIRGGGIVLCTLCFIPLLFRRFVPPLLKELGMVMFVIISCATFGVLESFYTDPTIGSNTDHSPTELLICSLVIPVALRVRFMFTIVPIFTSVIGSFITSYFVFKAQWTIANFVGNIIVFLLLNGISLSSLYLIEKTLRRMYVKIDILEKQEKILDEEKHRTEKLLMNILPASVIENMKTKSLREIVDQTDSCSVLFSDIVSFTKWSSTVSAEKVVAALNKMFSDFDVLSNELKVEKIKTIGDAFFASCNLPHRVNHHQKRTAMMALRMMGSVEQLNVDLDLDLHLRIGIACGPALAGVIGTKKISYEVLGETTTLAHHLEATSKTNFIQISKLMYENIRDSFRCKKREPSIVSHTGETIITFFLLGLSDMNLTFDNVEEDPLIQNEQFHDNEPVVVAQPSTITKLSHDVHQPSMYDIEEAEISDDDDDIDSTTTGADIDDNVSYSTDTTTRREKASTVHTNGATTASITDVDTINRKSNSGNMIDNSSTKDKKIANFRSKKNEESFKSYLHLQTKSMVIISLVLTALAMVVFLAIELFMVGMDAHKKYLYHYSMIVQYVMIGGVVALCIATCVSIQRAFLNRVLCVAVIVSMWIYMFFFTLFPEDNTRIAVFYTTIALISLFANLSMWIRFILMLLSTFVFAIGLVVNLKYRPFSRHLIAESAFEILLFLVATHLIDTSFRESFALDMSINRKIKMNNRQRQKSENLLLNVIPSPILNRLKQGSSNIIDKVNSATVMFLGVVDFEQYLEQALTMRNNDQRFVLDLLSTMFERFDLLTTVYHTEKIKSVGSTYMTVTNLFNDVPDHAQNCARLALEMMRYMNEVHPDISITIGFHSGSMVAAIIGQTKFRYDIWGDVVNLASRMMSSAKPNTIQCSRQSFDLLTNSSVSSELSLSYIGNVEMKGKGQVETYELKR